MSSSRLKKPDPPQQQDEYEGDLKALRDQLKVLRDLLGDSYVEYIGEEKKRNHSFTSLSSLQNTTSYPSPLFQNNPPPWRTSAPTPSQQIDLYIEALKENRALQERLRRLLQSIETAQNSCQEIRDKIHAVATKKRSVVQAPLPRHLRRIKHQQRFSGRSWFWSLSNAPPPPPYQDQEVTANILQYIPSIQQRSTWMEEEKKSLQESVVQRIQEQRFHALLTDTERDIAQHGKAITPQELQQLQAPIKALSIASPDVVADAEKLTVEDWEAIAHRSIPGKSSMDCMLQWCNAVNPGIKQVEWSAEEDRRLLALVDQHGVHSWALIAVLLSEQNNEDGAAIDDTAAREEIVSAQKENGLTRKTNDQLRIQRTTTAITATTTSTTATATIIKKRTPLMCLARYQQLQQHQRRPLPPTDLSQEELERLTAIVAKHGSSWHRITEEFNKEGWGGDRLLHRYRRYTQRTEGGSIAPRVGRWSEEEDIALKQAVAVYGLKWSSVAKLVPGRTDVQCRERYTGVLGAGERKLGHFSKEEDAALAAGVHGFMDECGNLPKKVSWCEVAKLLPGRSDAQCRKRWLCMQRESTARKSGKKGMNVTSARIAYGDDDVDQPGRADVVRVSGKVSGNKRKSGGSGGGDGGEEIHEHVVDEEEERKETKKGRIVKTPGWLKKDFFS